MWFGVVLVVLWWGGCVLWWYVISGCCVVYCYVGWCNKIIISSMDYNQIILRQNRLALRIGAQRQYGLDRNQRRIQHNHHFSQPKVPSNPIKINKNKLPRDFFQKKEQDNKQIYMNKINLYRQPSQHFDPFKKTQSERLHYSPEKTSFFGVFQELEPISGLKISGANKLYNRKFQTRDEPKRDTFPIEFTRKLTTATKNGKNQFIDLFPSTHDQELNETIASAYKSKNTKISPRKELIIKNKDLQPIIDPQKQFKDYPFNKESDFLLKIKRTQQVTSRPSHINLNITQGIKEQNMNITFYNAKSSCFPPINRHLNA